MSYFCRPNISKSALFALSWSTLVFTSGWKSGSKILVSVITDIVQLQAYLITAILGVGTNKQSSKALSLVCINNYFLILFSYEFLVESLVVKYW